MPEGLASTVRLFTDDTITYLTVTSDADANTLQDDLNQFADWEGTWFMKFHPEKCNVHTITNNRKILRKNCTLHMHIHVLEQVTSAKYLCVTIIPDLKWSQHIKNICEKANSTIGFLKRNPNISHRWINESSYRTFARWADFYSLRLTFTVYD
jgi:hypothetical protein